MYIIYRLLLLLALATAIKPHKTHIWNYNSPNNAISISDRPLMTFIAGQIDDYRHMFQTTWLNILIKQCLLLSMKRKIVSPKAGQADLVNKDVRAIIKKGTCYPLKAN